MAYKRPTRYPLVQYTLYTNRTANSLQSAFTYIERGERCTVIHAHQEELERLLSLPFWQLESSFIRSYTTKDSNDNGSDSFVSTLTRISSLHLLRAPMTQWAQTCPYRTNNQPTPSTLFANFAAHYTFFPLHTRPSRAILRIKVSAKAANSWTVF